MIHRFIPGVLAFGMIASTYAKDSTATAPATPEAAAQPAVTLTPAEVKESSSYALGYRAGSNFAQQFGRFGLTVQDLVGESFMKGFFASFQGQAPELAEEKLQAAMQSLGDLLQAREKAIAATNLEAGKKFLTENGKRSGVITTKSGLQYEILAKGGEEKYVQPKEGAEDNKQFQVRYKGTLLDGKKFDESPAGETVPMTLQVVPGFKEALTTMPVGAKWKLFLPAELAYGEQRRSSDIGPNSVLVFELELVKIEDAPPQQAGGFPFPMPSGE